MAFSLDPQLEHWTLLSLAQRYFSVPFTKLILPPGVRAAQKTIAQRLGAGALGFYTQLVHKAAPPPPRPPPHLGALLCGHLIPIHLRIRLFLELWVGLWFSKGQDTLSPASVGGRGRVRRQAEFMYAMARTGHASPSHGCSALTA